MVKRLAAFISWVKIKTMCWLLLFLFSSKVSACSLLIKESGETELGGMVEQSLLKHILSLRPNQCGCSLVFTNLWQSFAQCFALCSIKNPLEPSILENLPITTLLSLPVQAFLQSLSLHLPTSSNWTLWWIEGPSIQWRIGLPHTLCEITHLLCVTWLYWCHQKWTGWSLYT